MYTTPTPPDRPAVIVAEDAPAALTHRARAFSVGALLQSGCGALLPVMLWKSGGRISCVFLSGQPVPEGVAWSPTERPSAARTAVVHLDFNGRNRPWHLRPCRARSRS